MGNGKSNRNRSSNPKRRSLSSQPNIKKRSGKKLRESRGKYLHSDKPILNDSNVEDHVQDEALIHSFDSRGFFLREFESTNSVRLSSLELESIKESSFVDIPEDFSKSGRTKCVTFLGDFIKGFFGPSWKEELCEDKLREGEIEEGSPSVLMISSSATRTIELLRGVRSMTTKCHGAKLFSKHMKLEEQAQASADVQLHITSLKKRVNFASGTPSRLKKLIDVEALKLSRLKFIVIDIDEDVKGYSLLTLPQVKNEFWELYVTYFHQSLLQGNISICLFGYLPKGNSKGLEDFIPAKHRVIHVREQYCQYMRRNKLMLK